MLIDRDLAQYTARETDSIEQVAGTIAEKKGRIALVVDSNGLLLGTVSNGDLIRWLGAGCPGGTNAAVLSIANREFRSVNQSYNDQEMAGHLSDVLFVPVVDDRGRLVAVARRRKPGEGITIEGRTISRETPTFTIAEIGNNHNGSLDLALRLIDAAAEAGADCAKFQMRNMQTLYGGATDGSGADQNLGTQYVLDLLARYQLSEQDLFRCFDHCRDRGLIPMCTPWDESSLEVLCDYGIGALKVASADFTNHDFLIALATSGRPLVCSTGMSAQSEIEESVELLRRRGAAFALLHCNSTYPAPFRDINLKYLDRLARVGECIVGYSGHERDIFISIAAVAMGARIVEKHFTFDRDMEGNDHRVSLLPSEFARMVEGIRQTEAAMGSEAPRRLTQGETMNRVTLAKSVFASQPIAAGTTIEESMLQVRSPGQGLQPNKKLALIGRTLTRDVPAGTPFFPSDLVDVLAQNPPGPRSYQFTRPWGIPVRHHDYQKLLEHCAPDFLEFHLSYRDLEIQDSEFFDNRLPLGLVVHAPELFAGDHVLDLCSPDEDYRSASVGHMQRVLEKTRSLQRFFNVDGPTGVVTNVGGFSIDRPLTPNERAVRRDMLHKSVTELDTSECAIWPQTMPPYPWHFGGQRFHNLFVESQEIEQLCTELELGLCFDVSHSKLACNLLKSSFEEFVAQVAPFSRHLHVADAAGMDGEGLQIGDGEIDFAAFFKQLDNQAPAASFLPEIWQGHENNGEGFWTALDRLEQTVQHSRG